MIYLDEFRNVETTKSIINKIYEKSTKTINIMEVCGTHTRAIYKNGINKLLPSNITLLSGPGCPICVTHQSYINEAIKLSQRKNIIIATFGDMMKVPGSESSLTKEKAKGYDIRVVYSPLDCISLAENNKDKEVIFLGVGFETTSPVIGLCIKDAYHKNIKNFSLLHSLKTMPKAMEKLILDEKTNIHGFICPGHVGSIIGYKDFDKLARNYTTPMAVAGFEYLDIVGSIYKIVEMIENEDYRCENMYSRLVKENGNKRAKDILNEVYDISSGNWRGLGKIEKTGLDLKDKYKDFDAYFKFNIKMSESEIPNGCLCGEILKGIKKPTDCKLFKNICNPNNPIGACMVSSEGTCASFFYNSEWS